MERIFTAQQTQAATVLQPQASELELMDQFLAALRSLPQVQLLREAATSGLS